MSQEYTKGENDVSIRAILLYVACFRIRAYNALLSPDTKAFVHRCCPVDQHGVCQLMSFGYSSFRRCTKLVIIINYHHRRSGPRTEQLLLLATTCNFKFTFFFPFNYHFRAPITYLKYNRPPRILHSLLKTSSSPLSVSHSPPTFPSSKCNGSQ